MRISDWSSDVCSSDLVEGDTRIRLGTAGAVASLEMNASLRRRAVLAAWFLAVGVLPRRPVRNVLSWKLVASQRPPVLAPLSQAIRRVDGGSFALVITMRIKSV